MPKTRRRALLGAFLAVDVLIALAVFGWYRSSPDAPARSSGSSRGGDPAWEALDPQARCTEALALVDYANRWKLLCRWRTDADRGRAELWGQSYPPPAGEPPWDDPRIEIYVTPEQDRAELGRVIAHEMGHMHHTRQAGFASEWLEARGMADTTPWTIWTEDYAEVFAAAYGPPFPDWAAPTSRPTPDQVALLKARFLAQ